MEPPLNRSLVYLPQSCRNYRSRSLRILVILAALVAVVPIAPASAAVSFSNGWETGITGNGLWYGKQEVSADRLQRVTDIVRKGLYSLRVEVNPGDDPLNSSGERAEVLTMTDSTGSTINENASSGTKYFAFSVRLDPNWQTPAPDSESGHWSIILQLHGDDSYHASPAIAFYALDRFLVTTNAGNLDSNSGRSFELSNSSLNKGYWVDFIMKVSFDTTAAGEITVWRRDEGEADFTQVMSSSTPTLQYLSATGVIDHYWKAGLYRNTQSSITSILWLDGITRADTFEEVGLAAFPPLAPVLSAQLSGTQAVLSWVRGNYSVAGGYHVYRNSTLIGTIASTTTTFTDSGLAAGTTYSYSVSDVDSDGNEAASNRVTVATAAVPQANSVVVMVSSPSNVGTISPFLFSPRAETPQLRFKSQDLQRLKESILSAIATFEQLVRWELPQ